jgi:hypothetical protein
MPFNPVDLRVDEQLSLVSLIAEDAQIPIG